MKPLRLYIKDFLCYESAYIDFSEFSSALVVGKKENNDMYSNGVGKTTIFKAMEYVLFNHTDCPMEKIIRDDTNSCQIVFDFMVGNQEYRLARSRTKKGSSDLTLLYRNAVIGNTDEVLHDSFEQPFLAKKEIQKFWVDKSGSRAGDTEKDLGKLIKLNHKAFTSTALFPQNDMSGLPTATPEKRKGILKDGLDLIVYSKLEKIAKERAGTISKEIEKNKLLLENIGDPTTDLKILAKQATDNDQLLQEKTDKLVVVQVNQNELSNKISELTTLHSNLESKFSSLLAQEKSLSAEKNRLEISVKEYTSKKNNAAKTARDLIDEVKSLKEQQVKLIEVDYSQINIVSETISALKEELTKHNLTIKTSMESYEDLKIPLPTGSKCKYCRKAMSDKDRENHSNHIAEEMDSYQKAIASAKEKINFTNKKIFQHNLNLNGLNLSKQQLEGINTKITGTNKEIQDKKTIYEEYSSLLTKFQEELKFKTEELTNIQEELKNSSVEEAESVQKQIETTKKQLTTIVVEINELNKVINHYSGQKAVLQHTIDRKTADIAKKALLTKDIASAMDKLAIYPFVIQGFSSTGIPNLIIQNVLDDLQIEANNLLAQLKPGLQLSFVIEKTVEKTGDQADTLGINYMINGKERYYKQLSGAMQLAVAFSLKLGFSFLLQKTIGTDIRFLLLDEIDQSLDKASVDAFADIVKFFQKDFTILIITHNDRLKDKFSHAILVEQDINMVSRAKVVSSW